MSGWDPYLDLSSGVLRNRLGITDPAELARADADLTALRLTELRRTRLLGDYDLAHLQAFHRYIFGDVYDWAGQIRTVTIGKGTLFCLPEDIPTAAAEVFARLAARNHLRGLDRDRFLDQLTELFSDINALHPFREGNGRTQRAFLGQLANDAGYELRWATMDPRLNIEASRAAQHGDLDPLHQLLNELVRAAPAPPQLPTDPGS